MNPGSLPLQRLRSALLMGAAGGLLTLLSPPAVAAGLKGWWKFDGNLNDSSGTGLNGTLINAPAYDAEVPPAVGSGQSILFDTISEGVRLAANAALNGNQFTMGYFIKPNSATPGSSGLKRLTARQGFAFETAIGDAHAIGTTTSPTLITLSYYSPPPGSGWRRTDVVVQPNVWLHVAWRNSITPVAKMELFLNGTLAYTGPAVSPAAPLSGFMNFGTSQSNVEGFDGRMDDAFLWDGVLTDGEIAAIAAGGVSVALDGDGDGLPNAWETQYGLDPNDDGGANPNNGATGDPDNDGLANAEEYTRGTNPSDSDSDDDGLNDGDEVARGTNPAAADTDGDGLSDGDEVARSTNPLVADTDGDGINDGDEVAASTGPLDPASTPPASNYLVLHLMCEGNADDSSTLANHGSLLGGPAFADGESSGGGQAMALTANNMGISVPANNSYSSNAFTLSYWVKPTSLQEGSGVERLTSRDGDAFETAIGNRAGIPGGLSPDLTLSYYQGAWLSSGTALTLNDWTHVAWRNKGTGPLDMALFINGQPVYTGPGVPAGRPGGGLMNIGTRWNGTEGFEGLMDDVRLYRAPLKDSYIASIAAPVGLAPLDFVRIVRAPDGSSVTLTIQSRPNRTYAVDFSTGLNAQGQPGGWLELTDSVTSVGAETVFVDDLVAPGQTRLFYRARDVTP